MTKKQKTDLINKELSIFIAECMFERKALDVKIMDVSAITSMADYFVICSSESDPQTKAIMDNIRDRLRDEGVKASHIEGAEQLRWVLMDYLSILVHVFHKDTRDYYGIERLWADAEIIEVQDTGGK